MCRRPDSARKFVISGKEISDLKIRSSIRMASQSPVGSEFAGFSSGIVVVVGS